MTKKKAAEFTTPTMAREMILTAMQNIVQHCPDPDAKTYANAVLKHDLDGAALDHQIPYIQINMGAWRGELARSTKIMLKLWQKEYAKMKKLGIAPADNGKWAEADTTRVVLPDGTVLMTDTEMRSLAAELGARINQVIANIVNKQFARIPEDLQHQCETVIQHVKNGGEITDALHRELLVDLILSFVTGQRPRCLDHHSQHVSPDLPQVPR